MSPALLCQSRLEQTYTFDCNLELLKVYFFKVESETWHLKDTKKTLYSLLVYISLLLENASKFLWLGFINSD